LPELVFKKGDAGIEAFQRFSDVGRNFHTLLAVMAGGLAFPHGVFEFPAAGPAGSFSLS
jgi:hypothetical protein